MTKRRRNVVFGDVRNIYLCGSSIIYFFVEVHQFFVCINLFSCSCKLQSCYSAVQSKKYIFPFLFPSFPTLSPSPISVKFCVPALIPLILFAEGTVAAENIVLTVRYCKRKYFKVSKKHIRHPGGIPLLTDWVHCTTLCD
eukprot:TRINITY_DN10451_c2_g1_i2.p1 TRINITY_DN10451_c2_g1~~TRINITY_DN10451_c2_g1_i2.p1  ORF type:complete len:140 (+),score=6.06 TRINITY_DN10451_c2_g1_i2:450-869(+)